MRINISLKLMIIVIILALGQLVLIGILSTESEKSLEVEANNRLEIQKQQVEIQAKNFRDLIDTMHRFTGNNIETNLEVAKTQFKKQCGSYVEKVDDYLVCENGRILEDRINKDQSLLESIRAIVHGHASIFVDLGNNTAKKIATTVIEGQYVYGYIESVSTYNQVIRDGETVVKYTKKNGIYKTKSCMPLKDSSDVIVGMMCVGIPEKATIAQIKEKVKESTFGQAGRIVLVDTYEERYGQIIYHPNVEAGTDVSEKPHIKEMLADPDGGFNFHYEGGNPIEHVAYFIYYEPYDMMIVAENELLEEQIIESKKIVTLSLMLLVISIAFAFLFSRTISGPIKKLKEAADMVTSGDFNVKIPHSKIRDEVSDLAASMEMLISGLKARMKKKE